MEDAVGAGYVKQSAVHSHIGGDGSGASIEWDGADGLGAEVVDQDALVAGDDINLRTAGRNKKVDGMESALLKIDVKGREGCDGIVTVWAQAIAAAGQRR